MKWLVWTLLGNILAQADEAALRVLALDGGLGDGVPAVVERVLGEDAVIRVVLLRSPGADDEPALHADALLSGGTIAAPLTVALPFRLSKESTHPALLEGSLNLPSPDTAKAITQIVTLYRTSPKTRVASFTLRWVSVPECRAALTLVLAGDASHRGRRLIICGSLHGLREQLHAWMVPFDDLHDDYPAHVPSGSLLIASDVPEDARPPEQADGASVFIVHGPTSRALQVLRKKSHACCTEVWLHEPPDWRHSALLIRLLTDHLKASTICSAL